MGRMSNIRREAIVAHDCADTGSGKSTSDVGALLLVPAGQTTPVEPEQDRKAGAALRQIEIELVPVVDIVLVRHVVKVRHDSDRISLGDRRDHWCLGTRAAKYDEEKGENKQEHDL
jgi:hypothetical protein